MKLSEMTISKIITSSAIGKVPGYNQKENLESSAKSAELLLDAIKDAGYKLQAHQMGISGTHIILIPIK